VLVVCFGTKKRSAPHRFKGNSALNTAGTLPSGTRILLRPGRPRVSDAAVEQLRESFVPSPRKSRRCASRETGSQIITLWRVLRKSLHLKA
jgi:hypothetical protein